MLGLRYHLTFGAAALCLSIASLSAAQDYRNWDRNNDGVITRSEWRGTLQAFNERDWNRDGVISGDELRDAGWAQSGGDTGELSFASLDRNQDGRLTRGEWRGDRASFLRADRNGDNFVSRGEFTNLDASYETDITDFDALDDDGNGVVARGEWRGTGVAFNRLDVNNDGVLSRREMNASDIGRTAAGDFGGLDYNNNGVISRNEWPSGAATFNRYDVNRDGVISRREYATTAGGGSVEEVVVVDAQQPWTPTNVFVNAGDILTVRADGTIQMMTGTDDRATPAGSITGRTANNAPRPDQRAGVLLMRIGNGPVEVVGADRTITAPNSGRVAFGINDDHFPDNSGTYRVSMLIGRR